MPNLVLSDLAGLSGPAEKLIEKVSDAVGGIAKPWQIERVGRAEAKAEVARAKGRIEISELEERALQRMVREEGERQANIEAITAQATAHLSDDAKPENVEKDWISNFFDKARLTSDEQMQELWAKVLAGEANSPGRYSKRTIEIVSHLEKEDAELFTNACQAVWRFAQPTIVVRDHSGPAAEALGLDFMKLSHLQDIGLLTFQSVSGYKLSDLPKNFVAAYYNRPVLFEMPKPEKNSLKIGMCLLTNAGIQLCSACQARPSHEYFEATLLEWAGEKIQVALQVEAKELYIEMK